MARNTLKLDTKGFEQLLTKLDSLGGNMVEVVDKALSDAGKKIGEDTHKAMAKEYLPAGGKYSNGDTEKTIIDNPQVEWSGSKASIDVGFDFGKPGAGGFLITGTPKMDPDQELKKIYKGKKYMKEIQEQMANTVGEAITKAMG